MIHAYASICRRLMHDIIIEIREKACVYIHHLEIGTQEWNGNNCQPLYREYMSEEGVWGASAPRSQRNEKKSNKMAASPFR